MNNRKRFGQRIRGWLSNEPLIPQKMGMVKYHTPLTVLMVITLVASSSAAAYLIYTALQPSILPLVTVPNPPTTPGLSLLDWIYIWPDGSLRPEGASNVLKQDGNVYSLTSNIYNGILIQREGAVLDGTDFKLEGPGMGNPAITIQADNVTVKDMQIIDWHTGILGYGNGSSIIDNYIMANVSMRIRGDNYVINNNYLVNTPNGDREQDNIAIKGGNSPNCGIELDRSAHGGNSNKITNNQIFDFLNGIRLGGVTGNLIAGNNLVNNTEGITLLRNTTSNTFTSNNITSCSAWAVSPVEASNNAFFGNNFIDNQKGIVDGKTYKLISMGWSINQWDNGTIGDFWSDYQTKYPSASEKVDSGILDTPYEIYPDNIDNYPLSKPAFGIGSKEV
jgi:parallel beta-helix repeat protein